MMVMPMMISEPAPSPWMARKAISWAMVCDSPESAERAERVEALVAVRPCHAETVGLLLDVLGPAHGLGQRRSRLDRVGGIVEAQPLEGIDARVVVGPRDSERVAADQMHILGLV